MLPKTPLNKIDSTFEFNVLFNLFTLSIKSSEEIIGIVFSFKILLILFSISILSFHSIFDKNKIIFFQLYKLKFLNLTCEENA